MNHLYKLLLIITLLLQMQLVFGQDSLKHGPLTLEDAFRRALLKSYQLKVSGTNTQQAHQQLVIARSERLPEIASGLIYGYVSNSDIWDPSFSGHRVSPIPHHLTSLTAQTSEIIFKGKAISNSIKSATLEEQIAVLAQAKNQQDIKLLVAARYLDIYRLMNATKVYENNIILTRERLKNVNTMFKQGMVTQNDVLRTALTISDLQLTLRSVNNDIRILNQQLNMIIGLPDSARLEPEPALLQRTATGGTLSDFISQANSANHDLKIAEVKNRLQETNIKLQGSDLYPEISLFAGSVLQRPFINTVPAADIYYNVWRAGVNIRFNISAIYQSPKKIKSAEIVLEQSRFEEALTRQNVEVSIKGDYIKYNQAKEDLITLTDDLRSAEENYRIVEKKYFNQLSLLTDMIDAANTKIEAEIKVTTARITVIYIYCQLLNHIGTL